MRNAVIAHGLQYMLESLDLGLTVTGVIDPPAEPVAPEPKAVAAAPVKKVRRYALPAPAPKAAAKPVKAVAADSRGSIRDAVRATLTASGKNIVQIVNEVQRTFPEKNRDYVGTVLCQLAKGGECELGGDFMWRKSA